MASSTVSQSSQDGLVASSQQPDVPSTPTLENANLPAQAVAEGSRTNSASLTPPPSSEELRNMLTEALSAVQEAKTTAAHYKLQHQMAQMESGEAVERMAVEMDMAKRELEVVQRTEVQRQYAQKKTSTTIQPESDPNFRLVHIDVYQAMTQEIRDIKLRNAYLERENAHQKKVVLQQENEIATLNDRVLLMRERIREHRDHLARYRRTGSVLDGSPRTPARHRPQAHGSQRQPGFAALLQATDIVSQSSAATFYTPQQPRRAPMQAPHTAPMPRKRVFDATQSVRAQGADSDGTVSADDDSEAETEVPDREENVDERRADQVASEMLKSPLAGRAKTSGQRGMVQSKLYGQIRKPGVYREEQTHKRSKIIEPDETRDEAPDARLQSFRAY